MYIRCPVCGDERAILNYQFFGERGHVYLSSYGPFSAIRCPQSKQCVWLERKSGQILSGEPWAKKVVVEA